MGRASAKTVPAPGVLLPTTRYRTRNSTDLTALPAL
jgi:hypothetical protein